MSSTNGFGSRVLDLDDDGAIEVKLGGKTFWIRQQRRAVLEKVVKAIYPKDAPKLPEGKLENHQYVEFAANTWRDTIPTFALILGVEQTDDAWDETIAHLEHHLTFPKACKIFERWWELNQVQDFFVRVGNPLITTDRVHEILAIDEDLTQEASSEPALPAAT